MRIYQVAFVYVTKPAHESNGSPVTTVHLGASANVETLNLKF